MRDRAETDVVQGRQLVVLKILENDASSGTPVGRIKLVERDAVDRDAPGDRPVQTQQQLEERGFAGAIVANQGERSSHRNAEIELIQNWTVGVRIGEGHALEADALCRGAGRRRRARSGLHGQLTFERQDRRDWHGAVLDPHVPVQAAEPAIASAA